jgi:hypothetical protein
MIALAIARLAAVARRAEGWDEGSAPGSPSAAGGGGGSAAAESFGALDSQALLRASAGALRPSPPPTAQDTPRGGGEASALAAASDGGGRTPRPGLVSALPPLPPSPPHATTRPSVPRGFGFDDDADHEMALFPADQRAGSDASGSLSTPGEASDASPPAPGATGGGLRVSPFPDAEADPVG